MHRNNLNMDLVHQQMHPNNLNMGLVQHRLHLSNLNMVLDLWVTNHNKTKDHSSNHTNLEPGARLLRLCQRNRVVFKLPQAKTNKGGVLGEITLIKGKLHLNMEEPTQTIKSLQILPRNQPSITNLNSILGRPPQQEMVKPQLHLSGVKTSPMGQRISGLYLVPRDRLQGFNINQPRHLLMEETLTG